MLPVRPLGKKPPLLLAPPSCSIGRLMCQMPTVWKCVQDVWTGMRGASTKHLLQAAMAWQLDQSVKIQLEAHRHNVDDLASCATCAHDSGISSARWELDVLAPDMTPR